MSHNQLEELKTRNYRWPTLHQPHFLIADFNLLIGLQQCSQHRDRVMQLKSPGWLRKCWARSQGWKSPNTSTSTPDNPALSLSPSPGDTGILLCLNQGRNHGTSGTRLRRPKDANGRHEKGLLRIEGSSLLVDTQYPLPAQCWHIEQQEQTQFCQLHRGATVEEDSGLRLLILPQP